MYVASCEPLQIKPYFTGFKKRGMYMTIVQRRASAMKLAAA